MNKKPDNHGASWTAEDDLAIMKFVREHSVVVATDNVGELASFLGRSHGATAERIQMLATQRCKLLLAIQALKDPAIAVNRLRAKCNGYHGLPSCSDPECWIQ